MLLTWMGKQYWQNKGSELIYFEVVNRVVLRNFFRFQRSLNTFLGYFKSDQRSNCLILLNNKQCKTSVRLKLQHNCNNLMDNKSVSTKTEPYATNNYWTIYKQKKVICINFEVVSIDKSTPGSVFEPAMLHMPPNMRLKD